MIVWTEGNRVCIDRQQRDIFCRGARGGGSRDRGQFCTCREICDWQTQLRFFPPTGSNNSTVLSSLVWRDRLFSSHVYRQKTWQPVALYRLLGGGSKKMCVFVGLHLLVWSIWGVDVYHRCTSPVCTLMTVYWLSDTGNVIVTIIAWSEPTRIMRCLSLFSRVFTGSHSALFSSHSLIHKPSPCLSASLAFPLSYPLLPPRIIMLKSCI